jgi:predicted transcriptional regulator
MPYTDAGRGLAKLREHGVVSTESEQREAGGVRYRYRAGGNPAVRARFMEVLRRAEALNEHR